MMGRIPAVALAKKDPHTISLPITAVHAMCPTGNLALDPDSTAQAEQVQALLHHAVKPMSTGNSTGISSDLYASFLGVKHP